MPGHDVKSTVRLRHRPWHCSKRDDINPWSSKLFSCLPLSLSSSHIFASIHLSPIRPRPRLSPSSHSGSQLAFVATMGFGGAALKFGSTALYALEFGCAAVVLGIYSYFLAVEADRDARIPTWQKAVTGLSGAVVLYTIFAVLLTCCLGGKVRTTPSRVRWKPC